MLTNNDYCLKQSNSFEMPKVDASDGISVTGHSHTLMFIVRSAGLKLYQKGWKNLNAKEKCFAE